MIHAAGETDGFCEAVRLLPCDNPFACRILSQFQCYRPGLSFVDYWLLSDRSGAVTGAAARNGSSVILLLTPQSDLEEISAFVSLSGAQAVLCDGSCSLNLRGAVSKGVVMQTSRPVALAGIQPVTDTPGLRDAYRLLSLCTSAHFAVPPFEDFYVDMNHKLRHRAARMRGVSANGQLAAMALTVAETEQQAVLGAVCCHPQFRRSGYGTRAVGALVNSLTAEAKTVWLHRAQNENATFYQKMGFAARGTWKEYHLR